MHRPAWISLCLVHGLCFAVSSVRAHSAPGVAAILDEDAAGIHALRLYSGLVRRAGTSWHFVCSKAYGGVGQDLAASLPGGGVAIAIPDGIVLMKRDGTFEAHPDPEARRGTVTAFARTDGKLYALRAPTSSAVSEVIAITDTNVDVLWTDTRAWSDIAVGESSLVLVRFDQDVIEELRLSFAGEVISRQATTLFGALAVSVRVVGDVPYYAAKLDSSSVLGRIEQRTWHVVLKSDTALAGPLALSDGTVMVSTDGVLSTLANDVATRLMDTDIVIGLSQLDGHPYACTRTGLREVSSTGLGAALFDLSQLLGPDECSVPEALRSDCELEWQHVQVELIGASIPLALSGPSDGVCPMAGRLAMPAASARADEIGAGGGCAVFSRAPRTASDIPFGAVGLLVACGRRLRSRGRQRVRDRPLEMFEPVRRCGPGLDGDRNFGCVEEQI